MSVYKRPGAATFTYDFQYRGHRFSGDTRQAEKRQARTVEGIKRKEAEATVAKAANLDSPKTWHEAATRWFNEVGAHHVNVEQDLAALAWLTAEIGKGKLLTDITDNTVARLVAKRRLEKRLVGRKAERDKQRAVSNATVNRTMTEPMRKVIVRAKTIWKAAVGEVTWSLHMLPEPQERVREASEDEEQRIMGELGRGYDDAVELTFLDGLRRMEVVGLKKDKVSFFRREYTVKGKGGKERTIPMSDRTYALFWRKKDEPTDFVFTYVAARTDKRKKLIRGQRYPITSGGLRTATRRAIARGEVANFRPHDSRHTAATRVLRTSNMRVVQKLLGHAKVTTTEKYAHAMTEDIRAALNAASPTRSPVTTDRAGAKVLGDGEK